MTLSQERGLKMQDLDMNRRAKKLIEDLNLTPEEIQQIVATARVHLATFDPDFRANVTQIAADLNKSRPTIYGWADKSLEALVEALRMIRTGRPPKQRPVSPVRGRRKTKD
jgi:hypothetical protein